MPVWVRPASHAFLAATLAALIADAALQTLVGLAAVASYGSTAPWWISAHVVERGRWVVLVALVVLANRRVAHAAPDGPQAWRMTGMAVMTIPLLWILSGWIVSAVLFTAAGRWDIDGRVFVEAGYYRNLLAGYVPWLLGGAAAVAWSSHAG